MGNVQGDDCNKSLLLITVRIDYSPSAALYILQICFNGIAAGNFDLFGWVNYSTRQGSELVTLINNGNRPVWSPIRFVIIRVIN